MKIVLWIGTGANQIALANKINFKYAIDTIFIEEKKSNQKHTFFKIIKKIYDRFNFSLIYSAWSAMMDFYKTKYPDYPNTKIIRIENINDEKVYNATLELKPDLIIVSGTRMIKDKLLSIKPRIGIINLHTGLSPYIKGGPNCTNWCISTNQFHLIGNTVMWIDKGIDSGNIITTELTRFNGNESLAEVHIKVMEHAHHLYLKAIEEIRQGIIKDWPQNQVSEGKTYYTKEWDRRAKASLISNFKQFKHVVNSENYQQKQMNIKTFGFD